ncbi:MAG: ATP-binding cassette domain-containing protein, partial [Pseudomonadota bacterium]
GLLGPNGAGKSTTMKMLTGYLAPDNGSAQICDFDVAAQPLEAKSMFGYLPEGAPAYADMTAGAFLEFTAAARGLAGAAAKAALEAAISAVQIGPVLGQKIDTLSKGFGRRVGLAQAILADPDVLILDEPTDGLDPNQKHEVRQLILSMAQHKAILISTHILEEVEALCSRAIIIDHGKIVADGTPAELKARAPHHGRISITLGANDAPSLAAALKQLPQVSAVDVNTSISDGLCEVTVAANASDIMEAVKTIIAEGNWTVTDIRRQDGRLDDAFRALTTGDRIA